jgi:hypothetical protein
VVITGSASTYQMAAATSAATATVAAGTLTTATPTITGTPSVGTELTGVTGAWGPSAVSFTYQWLRGTTVVGTSDKYTVVTADVGQPLTFKVFGTKDGYTSTNKTSTAVTGLGVSALIESGSANPAVAAAIDRGQLSIGAARQLMQHLETSLQQSTYLEADLPGGAQELNASPEVGMA